MERRNGHIAAVLHVAKLPEFGPAPPSRNALAELLSIKPEDILDGPLRSSAVSCGVPFLFIPLVSRTTLGKVRLNRAVWESLLAGFWAPHVYVITEDAEFPGSSIRARMFARAMGITEDPATGAAASALAGYLVAARGSADGTVRWNIEQGIEMGRPSFIGVEADVSSLRVTGIRVRGETVHVGEGHFDLK